MEPSKHIQIRGIRASIPAGYVLGRTEAGQGAPHLISLSELATKLNLQPTSGASSGGSGSSTLAGDSDVSISSPANGQVLTYNSTTSKWENSTAGSGSSITIGAHRFWGCFNMVPTPGGGSSNPCIADLTLHATVGGSAVSLTGATAYSLSYYSGSPASQAIDGVLTDQWNSNYNSVIGEYLYVDLGSGNTTALAEMLITTRNDSYYGQGAYIFDVMYSDDGVTWKFVCHINGSPFTAAGQQQTFSVPLTLP